MEIKECKIKTKCEIFGCKNLAEFTLANREKPCLYVCKNCAMELDKCLKSIVTPKSIPAPFKNQKKLEEK